MMLVDFLFYFSLYFFSGFILVLYLVIRAYFRDNTGLFNNNIIKDLFIYLLCILLWPMICIMVSYSLYEDWKFSKKNDQPERFELKPADLVDKISRCEVELRELVCDPLNAAPSIPFGFLNSVWLEFCESLEIQDELWTFDLIWEAPWGTKVRYAGYAAVRNKTIINILYTR